MVIQIRGNYKKVTLADQAVQITKIGVKALTYKTTLGIPQSDIDRITGADLMNLYISNAKSQLEGYMKGLNKYRDQLHKGNILQQMNAFQPLPILAAAPAAPFAGIWKFIDKRRAVWMKNDNFDETIGDDMGIIGPLIDFETDNYTSKVKIKVFPSYIQFKTDSSIIGKHRLLVGASGIAPLPFIVDFEGSTYKYYRTLPVGVTSEKLDCTLQGMWKNDLIGSVSATHTIAYKG